VSLEHEIAKKVINNNDVLESPPWLLPNQHPQVLDPVIPIRNFYEYAMSLSKLATEIFLMLFYGIYCSLSIIWFSTCVEDEFKFLA
jgi:hypothetical protein